MKFTDEESEGLVKLSYNNIYKNNVVLFPFYFSNHNVYGTILLIRTQHFWHLICSLKLIKRFQRYRVWNKHLQIQKHYSFCLYRAGWTNSKVYSCWHSRDSHKLFDMSLIKIAKIMVVNLKIGRDMIYSLSLIHI